MIQKFGDRRDWFFSRRFGMFIHWGLYSIDARQEQVWQRYGLAAEEYCRLPKRFNPRNFSPSRWLDLAEKNGMDYLVFTTKHHDGFCLWNSAGTPFNVMNTPYGRDVCAEIAAECRRRNMPLEWYYSVVDWHHENYPNLGRHHEITTDPAKHDWGKYLEFLKSQIRELCTGYGDIHGIWWDMNVPQYHDESIHEMIRELQPAAVVNNRGFGAGDYSTPERDIDLEGANPDALAFQRPTEACQSVGVNSWGFRTDEDYYTVEYFQRNIARTLARGGNYLLNVGPDADGEIPPEAAAILDGVGAWYNHVKPALVAQPAPGRLERTDVLATEDDGAIYVICHAGLESSTLALRPLAGAKRVTLMNTGEAVDFTTEPIVYDRGRGPGLRLRHIPADIAVPVLRIEK